MSLEDGILGYLSTKPLTGYDIKKLFNMSAAYFWPADQAQIYRALKNLSENGLVIKHEPQENERRKEYHITQEGSEALRKWLSEVRPEDFIQRSPTTLQLFFSGILSPEEQLAVLDTQLGLNLEFQRALKEVFAENEQEFSRIVELEQSDRLIESATYAYRWGLRSCESYGAFLEEIKAEILAKQQKP